MMNYNQTIVAECAWCDGVDESMIDVPTDEGRLFLCHECYYADYCDYCPICGCYFEPGQMTNNLVATLDDLPRYPIDLAAGVYEITPYPSCELPCEPGAGPLYPVYVRLIARLDPWCDADVLCAAICDSCSVDCQHGWSAWEDKLGD